MGAIEHLTISLPAGEVGRMRDRVAAGQFADLNEAVLEAWREFEAGFATGDEGVSDEQLKARIGAAFDGWRRDPTSALPLTDAITQVKRAGRAHR